MQIRYEKGILLWKIYRYIKAEVLSDQFAAVFTDEDLLI